MIIQDVVFKAIYIVTDKYVVTIIIIKMQQFIIT